MPETLLNKDRPPIFCPGCSHEQVLHALDRAFLDMGLTGNQICMVSDIGCSGFFDVFFNTHALHGVHGRALTYAAGIKLCRPDLHVVVTMGDGGLGIGGAHVLAACRRNLDLTLLVLNNFNFGMTGGQFSVTTPAEATVGSGFLNKLEKPLDLASVASAAGAPYVCRCSTYQKDLPEILQRAIAYKGFSVVEIIGICPGRYTKRNKITPRSIAAQIETQGAQCGAGRCPPTGAPSTARHTGRNAFRSHPLRARRTWRPGSNRPNRSGRKWFSWAQPDKGSSAQGKSWGWPP
ncbi:MAG: 2-oxoacid:ferredoxin oxidoreductase subunit beta [Deltaproteobacteria bacterium]|nr:2-oxoacid:ferredoxin oxidoreductase subunit beta [Deltaproteobacteria bacterium]